MMYWQTFKYDNNLNPTDISNLHENSLGRKKDDLISSDLLKYWSRIVCKLAKGYIIHMLASYASKCT